MNLLTLLADVVIHLLFFIKSDGVGGLIVIFGDFCGFFAVNTGSPDVAAVCTVFTRFASGAYLSGSRFAVTVFIKIGETKNLLSRSQYQSEGRYKYLCMDNAYTKYKKVCQCVNIIILKGNI